MLRTENTVTMSPEQWEAVIRGARNPLNSWDRMDSEICNAVLVKNELAPGVETLDYERCEPYFILGENDHSLMSRLGNAGPSHAKYRRMMPVWVDIIAPLYWWKEFDTYKIGTVANSCSTMHKIHSRDLELSDFSWERLDNDDISLLEATIDRINHHRKNYLALKEAGDAAAAKEEWYRMIQLLGTNYEQRRTVFFNYEVLKNLYETRKDHKLSEWHTLCDWIKTLPHSDLITGEEA